MKYAIPDQGYVFWPVGNGDSSTIIIDKGVVFQLDLNHMAKSEESDDPHIALIDELEKFLPKKGGKPYLSLFALSHPDQDHCKGFAELLERVEIGEIWFSPRVFREYKKDLCDDAVAFRKEVERRVKKAISSESLESGDRVRIIGYDDILKEDDFDGFPKELLTVPGNAVTEVDGVSYQGKFRAFIHSPFKDDSYGDRNDCSLGLQIMLINDSDCLTALFLGDLCYPVISRIFQESDPVDLAWNVFLAPHHCSKSVMYYKDEGQDEEDLKDDILRNIEAAELEKGLVIASSEPIPSTNKDGDNPPHAKAKARYQEIANSGFLCTQKTPNEDKPAPIVLPVGDDLDEILKKDPKGVETPVTQAVKNARGTQETPSTHVGFGK